MAFIGCVWNKSLEELGCSILKDRVLLTINDGSDLSLDDIHQLRANNCSVLRSAHVGNLDSQTLFLAMEGFSIILDEYSRGSMRVYRPAYEIKNGKESALSTSHDLPVTHLHLTKELFEFNNSVASYHYRSLISLFPDSIKLTSTHLLNQKSLIYIAIQILLQERPQSFARLIESDGKIFKFGRSEDQKIYFYDDIGNERKFEVSNFPDLVMSGIEYTANLVQGKKVEYSPIITLDVDADISLITLCDINWDNINSKSKAIKAVHFSGLEMINYMVKNKNSAEQHSKTMNEIFNLLIHIWAKEIPEKIELLIVPTDALPDFICETENEQNIINDSILASFRIKELSKKKSLLWQKHQNKVYENVISLSNKNITSLIKNIEPINSPESFVRTLDSIKEKLQNGIDVERKILNQLAINFLLYRDLDDVGITELNNRIIEEEKNMGKANKVSPAFLTQYDLLLRKKIYFPDKACLLSQNELRIFKRRIREY